LAHHVFLINSTGISSTLDVANKHTFAYTVKHRPQAYSNQTAAVAAATTTATTTTAATTTLATTRTWENRSIA